MRSGASLVSVLLHGSVAAVLFGISFATPSPEPEAGVVTPAVEIREFCEPKPSIEVRSTEIEVSPEFQKEVAPHPEIRKESRVKEVPLPSLKPESCTLVLERSRPSALKLPKPTEPPSDAFPVPGLNKPPEYPRVARLRGWEGEVTLCAHVGDDGSPREIRVQVSSGYEVLDEAAVSAVKGWQFAPARRHGQAVVSTVSLTVRFVLSEQNR
jgi:protein TonB